MERDIERLIIEASPTGKIVVDGEGTVLFMNAAGERMFGWQREELIGRSIDLLVPARHRNAHADMRRGFVQQPSARAMGAGRDLRALRKDETEFPVEIGLTPLSTEDGMRVLVSIIDITERKQLLEQTMKLELEMRDGQRLESLGRMAGSIAHDFNNLLVGILGNTSALLDEVDASSAIRPVLREIDHAAHRLADLCAQLLAYSGRGRFVIEPVDVNALVQEMVDLLGLSISRHARLRLDLALDPPHVNGDATQLRQVVMNLITNASEAIGDEPGSITLSTRRLDLDADTLERVHPGEPLVPGAYVEIEVSDTGSGMSPEVAARIFEPFFTTKFTGRGLGLAAVQGIVKSHRGAIHVTSEAGRGSVFRVILPAIEPAAAPERTRPASSVVSRPTVLVVDDEPTVRRVVRRVLEAAGHRVLVAEDGIEALRIWAGHRDEIRAVLLDLTMPRMDGRETFAALRAQCPDLPIVLTSGYTASEAVAGFDEGRAIAFLQKPFTSREVIAAIEIALGDAGER